jgi:hypothetical protein
MQLTWLKTLRQLGFKQTGLYALYQLELKSGFLRWLTVPPVQSTSANFRNSIPLPDPTQLKEILGTKGLGSLFAEADEIVSGKMKLFGGFPVVLDLLPPSPVKHWTLYRDLRFSDQEDIKFIWEPGRFGWAITLARAYFINHDERYAQAFWRYTEIFLDNNPAYLGVHWISAQEVALRLTCMVFAFQVFSNSVHSTSNRVARLVTSIEHHAMRIPPTLTYSRAQNNNHLLTEAMGLITAASFLTNHPSAKKWHSLGWKWFHKGLGSQIAPDGSYNQHSTNYHRLMLQSALWVHLIAQSSSVSFPRLSLDRLAAATKWLLRLLDPTSGYVPNLGPNDGAYLFPLTVLPFQDYRPLLQAAGAAFLEEKVLPTGIWNEMGLWFNGGQQLSNLETAQHDEDGADKIQQDTTYPCVIKSSSGSWAYLRNAHFSSRPGHADQLHLDLWWRGINLSLDPGTYLYNARPPWDNALTSTFVHNTVTIDQYEQMLRVGRFLYLDWAQAEICSQEAGQNGWVTKVVARHYGYKKLGIIHQRMVEAGAEGWRIEDQLLPVKGSRSNQLAQARLHWLLPDWEWTLDAGATNVQLKLRSPYGWITINISGRNSSTGLISASELSIALIRGGQVLLSRGKAEHALNPTWGWFSPTYGIKIPALSLSIQFSRSLPITFLTDWDLAVE